MSQSGRVDRGPEGSAGRADRAARPRERRAAPRRARARQLIEVPVRPVPLGAGAPLEGPEELIPAAGRLLQASSVNCPHRSRGFSPREPRHGSGGGGALSGGLSPSRVENQHHPVHANLVLVSSGHAPQTLPILEHQFRQVPRTSPRGASSGGPRETEGAGRVEGPRRGRSQSAHGRGETSGCPGIESRDKPRHESGGGH